MPAPDVAEVTRIAAIGNPVIRNLEITECYSRLAASDRRAAATAARTGARSPPGRRGRRGGRSAARISSTSCSASSAATASCCIPSSPCGGRSSAAGCFSADTRLGRLIAELHTPFDAFERPSDAVARGNRKVFDEIGLEFARYLQECGPELPPDSAEFQRFLAGLRAARRPTGSSTCGGRSRATSSSSSSRIPKRRAELIVLANVEIGLHEQTRLQPEIAAALTPPDRAITAAELDRRRRGGSPGGRAAPKARRRRLQRELADQPGGHHRCFMVLTLPGTRARARPQPRRTFPERPAHARGRRARGAGRALRARSRRRSTTAAPATGPSWRSACTTSATCSGAITRGPSSETRPSRPSRSSASGRAWSRTAISDRAIGSAVHYERVDRHAP